MRLRVIVSGWAPPSLQARPWQLWPGEEYPRFAPHCSKRQDWWMSQRQTTGLSPLQSLRWLPEPSQRWAYRDLPPAGSDPAAQSANIRIFIKMSSH